MRPSRSIALFALCALVLLRGLGMAADARAAAMVECCCGRHAFDQECSGATCPSNAHNKHKHHDDGSDRCRSTCAHHVDMFPTAPAPVAVAAPVLAPRVAPEAFELPARPAPRVESRVVHPESPPS